MYTAIVVAAGKGERTGLGYNKMFHIVCGKTVLAHAISVFVDDTRCDKIVVVVSDLSIPELDPLKNIAKLSFTLGGPTRQDSVRFGLKMVTSPVVLIHDGARPNLKKQWVDSILKLIQPNQGATLAAKAKDSLAEFVNGVWTKPIPREHAYQIQTPQGFMTEEIIAAHQSAFQLNHTYTDDAGLYLSETNHRVVLCESTDENLKVTTKFDLDILEDIIC